jgi:hypothetical protein
MRTSAAATTPVAALYDGEERPRRGTRGQGEGGGAGGGAGSARDDLWLQGHDSRGCRLQCSRRQQPPAKFAAKKRAPKVGRALVRALTLTAKAEEVRSSEFAGGSELGPLAMADKVVLCTCERQGRWECESE